MASPECAESVRDELCAGGLSEAETNVAEYVYACGMCDYVIKEMLVGEWVDVLGLEAGMSLKRAVETARGAQALKSVGEALSAFERHGKKMRLQPLLHFFVLELALRRALCKKEESGIAEGQRNHFSFLVYELVQRGLSDVQWSAALPLDDVDCTWVMTWLAAIEFFLMHTVNAPQTVKKPKRTHTVQCIGWLVYTAAAGDMVDTVAASHVLPHALVCVLVFPHEVTDELARDVIKVALVAAQHMDAEVAVYTRWLAAAVAAVRSGRGMVPTVSFSAVDRHTVRTTTSIDRHLAIAVSRALDVLRLTMRQGDQDAVSRARALGAFDALLEYKALTGLDHVEMHTAARVALLTPLPGAVFSAADVRLELRRMFARALVCDASWIVRLFVPLKDMALHLVAVIMGKKKHTHSYVLDGELCALVVSMWDFAMRLERKATNVVTAGHPDVARFLMRVQRVERAEAEVTRRASAEGRALNVADLLPCTPRRTECSFCCGALDTERASLTVGVAYTRCSALCEALENASRPYWAT